MRTTDDFDYVALVNNDATVEPGWLWPLVEAMEADGAIGAAAPKMLLEAAFARVELDGEGTIAAVVPFGVFVALDSVYVEGLVHVSELGEDYFQYDAVKHQMLGERTGQRYRLGAFYALCGKSVPNLSHNKSRHPRNLSRMPRT